MISDQQKIADELINLIKQRVFTKIAPMLTEEDLQRIEKLNSEDSSGQLVKDYLVSKVPNYDALFEEEIELLRTHLNPSDS